MAQEFTTGIVLDSGAMLVQGLLRDYLPDIADHVLPTMKKLPIAIASALLIPLMAAAGLIYSQQVEGIISLSERVTDRDEYRKTIAYQAWALNHAVKAGDRVELADCALVEKKSIDSAPARLKEWIKQIDWVAARDLPEGHILLDADLEPKDPKKLEAFLNGRVSLDSPENSRIQWLRRHLKLTKLDGHFEAKQSQKD